MITKKLFTPKCQHVDRDLVFRDDLDNFFIDFLNWIKNPKNKQQIVSESNKNKEKIASEEFQTKNINFDSEIKIKNENNNPNICDSFKPNVEITNKINDVSSNLNTVVYMSNINNNNISNNLKNTTEDFIHNLEEYIEYKNHKMGLCEGNKDIFSLDDEESISINEEVKVENKNIPHNNSNKKSEITDINKNQNLTNNIDFINNNKTIKIQKEQENYLNQKPKNSQLEATLSSLSYKAFKIFWNQNKMSMLHFCKSKEENYKEYYEVLFGEVQSLLIENILKRKQEFKKQENSLTVQILAIYTLYSLYFTQTTDFFYQINTIPEYLNKINQIIKSLYALKFTQIAKELLLMVFRLHKADAFSIGVIPGLKTIILNKYGLPCEQRTNTYNDYMDINNNYKNLSLKEDDSFLNGLIQQYKNFKFDSLMDIKSVFGQKDFDKEMYCEYVNNKNKMVECAKNDLAFLKIDSNELDKNINNLDLQFNIFDNFV